MTVDGSLGETHRRLEGTCAAEGRLTLADDMELPGRGWQWGQADLVGVAAGDEALAADNVRPLVVQLRPKPTYALLTRQLARLKPSSSYFLECALVPDGRLKEKVFGRWRISRTAPSVSNTSTISKRNFTGGFFSKAR